MTVVDAATGEVLVQSSPEEARQRADRIKVGSEAIWQLVVEAYQKRDWVALGYSSWDDYTTREFGTSRLRLPREERTEVVQSLRDAGLSTRAIAAATGADRKTVQRALAQAGEKGPPAREDVTPNFKQSMKSNPAPKVEAKVTGTDGKNYSPKQRAPRPTAPPVTKAVAAALHKVALAASACESVDAKKLAQYADEVPVWLGNLVESMKAIDAFRNALLEVRAHES